MNDLDLSLPIEVEIMLTWECPNKCIFCEPNLVRFAKAAPFVLDFPVLRDLIAQINKSRIPTIFLSGGEPFARPDIPDIIRICEELGQGYLISTCGVVSSDLLLDCIRAGLNQIQFSIQGLSESHSAITKTDRSHWEQIIANLILCLERGLVVSVAVVPNKYNYKDIVPLSEMCGRLGVPHFRVLRLMPYSEGIMELLVHPRMIQEIRERLEEVCQKFGMTLDMSQSPGATNQSAPDGDLIHPWFGICAAGKKKFAVRPDGNAVPCYSFHDEQFVAGNILSDSIEDIWNHPLMKAFRTLSPDHYVGYCSGCSLKTHCYSCRAIAYNICGSIYASDPTCLRNEPFWSSTGSRHEQGPLL